MLPEVNHKRGLLSELCIAIVTCMLDFEVLHIPVMTVGSVCCELGCLRLLIFVTGNQAVVTVIVHFYRNRLSSPLARELCT